MENGQLFDPDAGAADADGRLAVERHGFLSLCRRSKSLTIAGRGAWLDAEHVSDHMSASQPARFLGAVSEGPGVVLTLWEVPLSNGGSATGRMLMESVVLRSLADEHQHA